MKKTILTALLLFAAAAVFAQSEYNFQRRSLFEKLPVTSKDIVFLGNSITDGGEWNELLANPRVKNRGISGDRSSWMLDRLDPIVGGQPRKLFLLIGTNDLAAGTPAAEVVANVRKIVERFQSESPRTKFYVQSVFPVNDSFKKYAAKHGRHDADIVAVNKGLQALCAEKGIVYIDLWTLLADKNGKLEKRAVTLGDYQEMTDTYGVLEGLSEDDYVAFPDETLCKPGAATTKTAPVVTQPDTPEDKPDPMPAA